MDFGEQPYKNRLSSMYILDKTTEFRVQESVFAPDTFRVETLPDNVEIFSIKGKVTSFHGEKTMYDVEQTALFKFTENSASTLQYQYLFDYRSKSVYTVRKKSFWPGRGRGTLYVWKGKGDEGEPFIEIQSSASRSQFTIIERETNTQLAKVQRSTMGPKRLLAGADTYKVKVSAGAEVAFMTILVVCSDEHYTDFNR